MKRLLILFLVGILLYVGLKNWVYRTLVTQGAPIVAAEPDYRIGASWAALPNQPAPAVWSDGWAADVFYIPPPSSMPHKLGSVPIDNNRAHRNIGKTVAALGPALSQAGAVYAPYYRHGSSAQPPQMTQEAATDQLGAFETYLSEYNRGRAFFLAVHETPNPQIMQRIASEPRLQERFGGVIRISHRRDIAIKPLSPAITCSPAIKPGECERVLTVKRKTVPLGALLPRMPVKRQSFALTGTDDGSAFVGINRLLIKWLEENAAKSAEPLGGFEDVEIAPIREPGQIDDALDNQSSEED